MSTALITGASSGIGFELAKICAANGNDLVLVSRNQTDTSDPVFTNVTITNIEQDLSVPGSAEKLYKQIKQKNITIDVLINNAGFGDFNLFVDADSKTITNMINLNILTLTELTQLVVRDMKKQGQGKILNLASIASFLPGPYMAVYYSTKHYVLAFSETLAEELRDDNITVTALCPGPTASKFWDVAHMSSSKIVNGKKFPSSKEVAEFGYDAMMHGRRVAVHGVRNKFIIFIVRFLPRKFVTEVVRKQSEPVQ